MSSRDDGKRVRPTRGGDGWSVRCRLCFADNAASVHFHLASECNAWWRSHAASAEHVQAVAGYQARVAEQDLIRDTMRDLFGS